ncbi:efflux RND transporter periplasmic adaptor subunit [Gemmata sp. JC673]|uniref:Efflux RND transporter periplasmic adaptor subunit n=1 Tax=Gemmata algarum TaxID=2975278 RepID=A0ABU5ESP1_9BACT|nr:efflux RND transporter periplasmic adaptor subunit [Gemmata algarum]MDY3558170.1 efflux RND transporter periplasmic adaptor subunit [Gemmata algarum]
MSVHTPTPPPPVAAPSPALPARPTPHWLKVVLWLAFVGVAGGSATAVALSVGAKGKPDKPAAEEKKAEDDKSAVTMPKAKQTAAGVETAPATAGPLRTVTWRTGRVALNEDRVAHISPPAEGIVREVPVRVGQTVAAGDVLAVIECREFGFLKLELVKARIAAATEREATERTRTTMTNAAELLKLLVASTPAAEIEAKLADKPIGTWRADLLGASARRLQFRAQLASLKSSSGAVAESVVLKAQAEADAADAAYASLVEDLRYQVRFQVRQAELKLREAETTLDVAKAKLLTFGMTPEAVNALDPIAEGAKAALLCVRAPFAGTVVEKHAVTSERVGPQFQMFVLADLDTVWVQADVFEPDLPLVRDLDGREVTFRSEVAGLAERPAKVVHTGDLVDKASRTLTLTAEAANRPLKPGSNDRALKPGMLAEIGFESGSSAPVVQVPVAAVLRHENKPFVFVSTAEDTFVKREVTLGRQSGDAVEILEGLRPAEAVVVRGGFVLKSELLKDQMVGE